MIYRVVNNASRQVVYETENLSEACEEALLRICRSDGGDFVVLDEAGRDALEYE